ncbi:hypothetical protein QBC37DRAFT_19185 [Rhypophila decipiens]|uniref:Uncharacterized protein n=1 Tax=Rhypophila decipiens TaxID=261697 RepID=A0AAN7B5V1_9PEZI|nr:hypothetical protein QBC37DRAFT_19185 [Rhypophila decipiens]
MTFSTHTGKSEPRSLPVSSFKTAAVVLGRFSNRSLSLGSTANGIPGAQQCSAMGYREYTEPVSRGSQRSQACRQKGGPVPVNWEGYDTSDMDGIGSIVNQLVANLQDSRRIHAVAQNIPISHSGRRQSLRSAMRASPTPWEIDMIAMVLFFLVYSSVRVGKWSPQIGSRGLLGGALAGPSLERAQLVQKPSLGSQKELWDEIRPYNNKFTIWDGPIPHELHKRWSMGALEEGGRLGFGG